jgi:hypothetical protein
MGIMYMYVFTPQETQSMHIHIRISPEAIEDSCYNKETFI